MKLWYALCWMSDLLDRVGVKTKEIRAFGWSWYQRSR